MSYIAPDADELKTRYPAFADVDSSVINYWLDDAQLTVTESWIEADYARSIIALAAHNMARQGLAGAESVGGMAGVTNFRSGSFSASFSDAAVSAQVKGGYASTPYGLEFQTYLRRNRGGPRLAGRLGICV